MTEQLATPPDLDADRAHAENARKVTIGALVGTTLEWYDFFIFGTAAALVFNKQFFVSGNAITAVLASFATLAIGFLARPLGGLASAVSVIESGGGPRY